MRRRAFDPARFAHSTEARLVAGFVIILYAVGGGLIWLIYGPRAALMGALCMTGGLLFFLAVSALVYVVVALMGRWAGD